MDTVERARKEILISPDPEIFKILQSILSDYTVDVYGVAVPKGSPHNNTSQPLGFQFIVTPTFEKLLGDIALAIGSGLPILLEGKSGVGKTSLIEEAARLVNSKGILELIEYYLMLYRSIENTFG
jgi:midasin (ATPase involved in ribosome maturation)